MSDLEGAGPTRIEVYRGPIDQQHPPAVAALIHAAAVAVEVFGDDMLEVWLRERDEQIARALRIPADRLTTEGR